MGAWVLLWIVEVVGGLQVLAGDGRGSWVRGSHEGWQATQVGVLGGRERSRQWQARRLKSVRGEESGKWTGAEEMASKCTYLALEASGWPGVHEGMGSKCVRVAERTGGEPKVAEQPLLHPGRWTLEQKASNVGC